MPAGAGFADQIGAMNMVYGILSALYYRAKTGKGQEIEVNLLAGHDRAPRPGDTLPSSTSARISCGPNSGIGHPGMQAPFGVYPTKDGYVSIAMSPFKTLYETLEAPQLAVYDDLKTLYDKRDEVWEKVDAETREIRPRGPARPAARGRHLVRRGEGHPPRRRGPAGQAHGHDHDL